MQYCRCSHKLPQRKHFAIAVWDIGVTSYEALGHVSPSTFNTILAHSGTAQVYYTADSIQEVLSNYNKIQLTSFVWKRHKLATFWKHYKIVYSCRWVLDRDMY